MKHCDSLIYDSDWHHNRFYFQVLRFSRLFKPAHKLHIWKKKKKVKPEEEKKEEGEKKDAEKKEAEKKEAEKKEGENEAKKDDKDAVVCYKSIGKHL